MNENSETTAENVNKTQTVNIDEEKYPTLHQFTSPVKPAERPIIGREKEMDEVRAAMLRPELCNVVLIAMAGSGKTALVQGIMKLDSERIYREVNLATMKNAGGDLAGHVKNLFDDAERFCRDENQELVLFIDEFHQIVQLSEPAVEVLKPALADSGTRGIRVIAATTNVEFRKWISPNQPLVERLQRIDLPEPDRATTVQILRGFAERYGVASQFYNNHLFEMIYDYTNRYVPANAQPRKSILVLDAMIGWHRLTGQKIDMKLLADVIYQSEGVNVAFRVDSTHIREALDKRVLAQKLATKTVEDRLQICCANVNDQSRPMGSFLFTGPTGVGKTELCKALAEVLFQDQRRLIRMDMTEYALENSQERFQRELTTKVWEHPYSIILLDEIEKACASVTRELLQVLDDGRLIDANGREVSFLNAYVVCTTNAGSEIYETISQYNPDDEGSGGNMEDLRAAIEYSITNTTGDSRFPPELLGRFDAIVPFQPLSENTMQAILKMKLRAIKKRILEQHNIVVHFESSVVPYLVKDKLDTHTTSGGARNIVRKLESEVVTKIARFINATKDETVTDIYVRIKGDMATSNKNQLKSRAYVEVYKQATKQRR